MFGPTNRELKKLIVALENRVTMLATALDSQKYRSQRLAKENERLREYVDSEFKQLATVMHVKKLYKPSETKYVQMSLGEIAESETK